MNRDNLIWLAIAGLLIAATGGVYMAARGIRNKNPGNIRHGSSKWQGMAPTQTDSAFVQFTDERYGIRALAKLLQNYQSRYDLNTVREIINRWAPPSENDTGAYVRSVAGRVGVNPDAAINVNDYMPELVTAIIKHENGVQPYSAETIAEGIALA